MVEETKLKFEATLKELAKIVRANDPVYDFLQVKPTGDTPYVNPLRMLPLEIVESFGMSTLQIDAEFNKHFKREYDVYLQLWDKHYEAYWDDRLRLIETYLAPIDGLLAPVEIFRSLSDQMIKIARRALLLKPDPLKAEQTHTRLNGDGKTYQFLRGYWIDDKGFKKRMISRHIGDRLERIEKEIGDLLHNRGYGVLREYRSQSGHMYDMVIQRGDMKTAVEVKRVDEDDFRKIFLFDELLNRFDKDYPGPS